MEPVLVEQILLSGSSNGIIKYKVNEWKGFCYKIPRNIVGKNDIKIINDTPALYFLFGEDNGEDAVYVGETDEIITRLKSHYKNKDFWNTAFVFTGMAEEPLEKAQVKYLENHYYLELKEAYSKTKLFKVINDNKPKKSPLSEESQIKVNSYMKKIEMLLSLSGYTIKELVDESINIAKDDYFYITNKNKGIDATIIRKNEGFLVLKGSTTAEGMTEATTQCFKDKARELRDLKIIINNVFQVDYLFKSASGAAVIIMGRNSNGRENLKNSIGESLKEVEEREAK